MPNAQLELLPLRWTAADRKALIHDKLHGYELRQAAREAKRKRRAEKRQPKFKWQLQSRRLEGM